MGNGIELYRSDAGDYPLSAQVGLDLLVPVDRQPRRVQLVGEGSVEVVLETDGTIRMSADRVAIAREVY